MLHKAAVLAQARAILEDHEIHSVDFIYPTEGGRMSEKMIRSSLAPWIRGKQLFFHPLNFFNQMEDFLALVQREKWNLAAFPLVGGRPFYRARKTLSKNTRFIVISDGTCECSTLWDFYNRIRIHSYADYVKALIMLVEVKADIKNNEAYSLFHPLPCCFASQTYPAPRIPVPKSRETLIRTMPSHSGPVEYVVQGYGVKYEDCIKKFHLSNPVTTVKHPMDSEDFVTGEDIVDVLRPKRIIGYCCEVLLYARKFLPEADCIAILDPAIEQKWGRRHNAVFLKQAELLGGIEFLSFDEYLRL